MRVWMECILNNSAARKDFCEWFKLQEEINNARMQEALLKGDNDEARNAASELVVYQRLYQRFAVELNEKQDQDERRLN